MKVPDRAEFERPPLGWGQSLLGWLAGVESFRLAGHSTAAQVLTRSIGLSMVLVSAPVACGAMGFYLYESFDALPSIERLVLASLGGMGWATAAIVGIDRTMLVASDAVGIGRWWGWVTSLLFRAGIATLMSSLFAETLVESKFSGVSVAQAQHVALDVSEQDAGRIKRLEGVSQGQETVARLDRQAKELQRQYDTLPISVRLAMSRANRCDVEIQRRAHSLEAALIASAAPDSINRLEIALAAEQAICRGMHVEAERRKDSYLRPIAIQIAENNRAERDAAGRLASATIRATERTVVLDKVTRDGYASLSGRKVGFERAKQLYPEIRRSAFLWQLFFLLAELLPVLLKTVLLLNNPPSSEAQADLAEEAGRYRMRARRAAVVERQFKTLLTHPEVRDSISDAMTPNAVATEHLVGFTAFLDELQRAASRQEGFAQAYPDLAAQSYEAYAAAVANALDALAGRKSGACPGA